MTAERFTAYVTKYALSSGIKKVEVEDCFYISDTMVKEAGNPHHVTYHGQDWHRTRAAAVTRAEEMRDAKIASLRKQIAKLEKLSFGGPDARS